MLYFVEKSRYTIKGRGLVIVVSNPFKCDSESWVDNYFTLLRTGVSINNKLYKVNAVESFAVRPRSGDNIGLLVEEL